MEDVWCISSSVVPFEDVSTDITLVLQAAAQQGPVSSLLESVASKWQETATSLQAQNSEVTRSAQELQTSFNSGLNSFFEEAQKVGHDSFCSPYRILRTSVATILICYSKGLKLKLKLIYDRLVSGGHLGPETNFSFSLKFLLDSCGLAIL
jgi:hypothetical protein